MKQIELAFKVATWAGLKPRSTAEDGRTFLEISKGDRVLCEWPYAEIDLDSAWPLFGECIEALKERGYEMNANTDEATWHFFIYGIKHDFLAVADTLPAALFAAIERLIDSEKQAVEETE